MSDRDARPIPETPVPEGFELAEELLVPAGGARTTRVARGDILQVIDVRGKQVSDVMAWGLADPDEHLSPSHTLVALGHLIPGEGESLFSNRRRPLLRIRRDTVGRHDLLFPSCDPERYERDFGVSDHASCMASIRRALGGAEESWTPRGELAWNVFMNTVVHPDGSLVNEEPTSRAGDHVELDVLEDLGVVATSCPQDLTACNGFEITETALRLFHPSAR